MVVAAGVKIVGTVGVLLEACLGRILIWKNWRPYSGPCPGAVDFASCSR